MALMGEVPGEIFKSSMRKAHKEASQIHTRTKQMTIKVRELAKVEVLGQEIYAKTDSVVKKTVNFSSLPPFQQELVKQMTNLDEVRRALYSIGWAGKKVSELSKEYRRNMRKLEDNKEITKLRKQFERRAESILDGVGGDIKIIKLAKRSLRKMPSIREGPTLLIAGYPNVGKSSILNALSSSKVAVQPYPFTTKSLLVGQMKHGYKSIQLVDTPGILDREYSNPIEKQAVAALKYVGKNLLFVFDVSESCGYPIEEQQNLLDRIKKELNPRVLVVYNKSDLVKKRGRGLWLSANSEEDMEKLKEEVFSFVEH